MTSKKITKTKKYEKNKKTRMPPRYQPAQDQFPDGSKKSKANKKNYKKEQNANAPHIPASSSPVSGMIRNKNERKKKKRQTQMPHIYRPA